MHKSKKILLLFDVPYTLPANKDYFSYLEQEEWQDELDVFKALKRLGFDVDVFGVYDDVLPFIQYLKKTPPDLVFISCESFQKKREFAPHIVAMLELMGIKYTGASSGSLQLCKDKGITKKILEFHNINVPKFTISERTNPLKRVKGVPFPAIVKPVSLEASEGIAKLSLVDDEESCLERIAFIHRKFQSDAIVEEFIGGRELYVGVVGNKKVEVFPPQELFMNQRSKRDPLILTYKAKWDKHYRKRWGIDSKQAKALDSSTEQKIKDTCKKIYKLFHIDGYARIDLRLREDGRIYFLEANPNPAIKVDDDFASSALLAGVSYDQLIHKITTLGLHK